MQLSHIGVTRSAFAQRAPPRVRLIRDSLGCPKRQGVTMAVIMCTKDLWRGIGGAGSLRNHTPASLEPGRLGLWAAKPVLLPEGDFCVAMHETTYLTLAFPLEPLPAFLGLFTAALVFELEHLGVPGPTITAELRLSFGTIEFARQSNRSLLGSLNDVGHQLDWALEREGECDPSVLLRIQHELNEMPHSNRAIPFPDQAVSLLFSGGGSA
jgi:hypothetical protein